VHVDGVATRSCVTLIESVGESQITTIEALHTVAHGKALQEAWIELEVPQCGYCQSGQLMSAAALLTERGIRSSGKPARGKTCPAIDGILEEGSEILEEYKDAPGMDTGLVAAAQAVEHYEIARYGTLCVWAKQLGLTEAAELLKATLAEEEATDEALSSLGEGGVNERAMQEAA
jgi:aerobic-type carbon monoxide dehydrogenase small subunit (CoxS/CutS family)